MSSVKIFYYAAAMFSCIQLMAARADDLSAFQPIVFIGSIQKASKSFNLYGYARVTPQAITIPALLAALGRTDLDPAQLGFYYDRTTKAVVLADRRIPTSGGFGTPVASIFTFGPAVTFSRGGTATSAAGDCTTLNASLPGTFTEVTSSTTQDGVTTITDRIEFITFGMSQGKNYIFKGAIEGLSKEP